MKQISYNDIPKGMFEHLRTIEDFIDGSKLSLDLLELIRLRVSQKNGCAYCVDMHHKELKSLGETELRLSSLCVWEETPYFTDSERVVLKYADILTQLDGAPITEKYITDLSHYFDKEAICFISLAIAQINTWNRLMKAFKFEPGLYKVGN